MLCASVCQYCMSAQGGTSTKYDVKNRGLKNPALPMLGYNYFLFAEHALNFAERTTDIGRDCFYKYTKPK